MAFRIEVYPTIEDSKVQVQLLKWRHFPFTKKITKLVIVQNYTVDKNFSAHSIERIAQSLTNPLTEKYILYSGKKEYYYPRSDWTIEVGFLPGVTDNIGGTVKELIEDLTKSKFNSVESIYSSKTYQINGQISLAQIKQLAESQANPLIERIRINDRSVTVPRVVLNRRLAVRIVNLAKSEKKLEKLSKSGNLALTVNELKTIRDYFAGLKRQPTDIELESLAQTWSEHCKHKIFNSPFMEIKEGLFQHYIAATTAEIRKKKGGKDKCVSVFEDNSGAFEFDDNFLITHKVETHNSPSALDPYGGAITGIVGVNRDTLGFGLGAKPIANTYGFCFASPFEKREIFRDKRKKEKLLSAERIMSGVIEGVNAGGNQSGIPTPQGFLFFHERFRGKPLVFVGTLGLIPKKNKSGLLYKKKARKGDYIVMAGGKVGKDGIHGATFSSEGLSLKSPLSAVQIGDPITQKKMSDALIKEARDLNLYSSITDNGAGGLSCSVSETARESGGFQVNLDLVPVKYAGLNPWEIWVSESQERMTLAVPPSKWPKLKKLLASRGVDAWKIGCFTADGKGRVFTKKKKIMDIDLDFLHNGLPLGKKLTVKPKANTSKSFKSGKIDFSKDLLSMLRRLNIASFRFITEQFDHTVQAHLLLPPLSGKGRVNAESTAITPFLGAKKGLILSQGLFPAYTEIDPRRMAENCLDTAVRNAVAAGADPEQIYLLDNFCWCESDKGERLYQLQQALEGLRKTALVYETPFISGKDSMFNNFSGFAANGKPLNISVLPTLLVSAVSVLNDISDVISLDFKKSGDLIYLLGESIPDLGGSEYIQQLTGNYQYGQVPPVKASRNIALYRKYFRAVRKKLISSAIGVTRGGLAVALAKGALAGELGVKINLSNIRKKNLGSEELLFAEGGGRILVSVSPENQPGFEELMQGIYCILLGMVVEDKRLTVKNGNTEKIIINSAFADLKKAYFTPLAKF